ncbi:MBL fold metallo-hydrolase [Niastella caeni]|uniref:MBL fold metallo-hydrolase n=1 Tax=Niastella caeni TaxID=2569763 RepID=A0A4S8HIK5_9BACT|nr:MBL fold metallo-hydrolase [Niastella caeni]THU34883.1 MBL fold metallo-hydrolase [Niastella caeni]
MSLFFIRLRFEFKRKIVFLFLFTVTLGIHAQTVTALSNGALTGPEMSVYFLDVGQGNCQLIKLPNGKFMLYDCGTTSSSVDPKVIAAKITAITGGNDIGTIFLSHPDADHISMIPDIKEAKNPLYVHISGNQSDYSGILGTWFSGLPSTTNVVTYTSNYFNSKPITKVDGDSTVNIYMIAANVAGDANTKSLVISIDFNSSNVMLSGDATATTERWILKKWDYTSLQSTILAFGHHGSNHSSSKNFLLAVKPNIGIFSASAQHTGYGHPRCSIVDVVEKLVDSNGKSGCTIPMHQIDCYVDKTTGYVFEENDLGIFVTYDQGNILFRTDGLDYTVLVDKLK